MSTFVYANNVNTSLAGPISSGATSLTLTSATNLPTLSAGQQMALTLNDAATQSVFEVVYVTAIAGAVCTVVRGQEDTSAQSWLAGDFAYAATTAGILRALAGSGSFVGSGYVALGGGLYLQWGKPTTVAFDGSAAKAVTFPIAFPTACFVVVPGIQNAYQTNPWQLAIEYDTATTTGFNLNVSGAPPGTTGTCTYFAIGT